MPQTPLAVRPEHHTRAATRVLPGWCVEANRINRAPEDLITFSKLPDTRNVARGIKQAGALSRGYAVGTHIEPGHGLPPLQGIWAKPGMEFSNGKPR